MSKVSYTAEGVRGLLKEGGSSRKAVIEKLLEGMGGRLVAFYFTTGDDDAFVISELPSAVDGVAISMAVGAAGAGRISTVELLTPEQIDEAAKKTVSYRPPGA
jgi:uncharacterized protein with GYD domain